MTTGLGSFRRYFMCVFHLFIILIIASFIDSKEHCPLSPSRKDDKVLAIPWREYQPISTPESIMNKVLSSIKANYIIANPTFSFVNTFKEFVESPLQSPDPLVFITHPAQHELNEFMGAPYSMTKSNEKHKNITVNGREKVAETWAENKKLIWQLPETHPRNSMRGQCVGFAKDSAQNALSIYKERKSLMEPFYILRFKNNEIFIHDDGVVSVKNGYWQMHENCELIYKFIGRKRKHKCNQQLERLGITWETMIKDIKAGKFTEANKDKDYYGCKGEEIIHKPKKMMKWGSEKYILKNITNPLPAYHKRVFMITAGWDSNYHHFIIDSVIRMVRYMDFLQNNPDIMIHIRTIEKYSLLERYIQGGIDTRNRILNLLNIDPKRIINGSVVADEVFIPRAGVCNSQMSHPLEVRYVFHIHLRFLY